MTIAHKIKRLFTTFSDALKAAWMIVKLYLGKATKITFAKDTGELRTAKAIAIGTLSTIEKGYLRFIEMIGEGQTQWRSFRIGRLVFYN